MVSYAVRFNVDIINLFYPNTVLQDQFEVATMEIKDKLANDRKIEIKAYQLPIINFEILSESPELDVSLKDRFIKSKENLKIRLMQILNAC